MTLLTGLTNERTGVDMAKKQMISGPGIVLDRSAKGQKIQIQFDPSPDGFMTEARKEKGRLIVTIHPGISGGKPIEFSAAPRQWKIVLQDASIPKDRLAELESLITQEEDVHVTIQYSPAPKLPGMGEADEVA